MLILGSGGHHVNNVLLTMLLTSFIHDVWNFRLLHGTLAGTARPSTYLGVHMMGTITMLYHTWTIKVHALCIELP